MAPKQELRSSWQSGPRSNGNEGVLYIPQSSMIGASSSDAVSCHIQDIYLLGGGAYTSAEMRSTYSSVPADWDERKE